MWAFRARTEERGLALRVLGRVVVAEYRLAHPLNEGGVSPHEQFKSGLVAGGGEAGEQIRVGRAGPRRNAAGRSGIAGRLIESPITSGTVVPTPVEARGGEPHTHFFYQLRGGDCSPVRDVRFNQKNSI